MKKCRQPRLRDYEDGEVVRLRRRLNTNSDVIHPILLVNMQSYSLYRCGGDYNKSLSPSGHYELMLTEGKRVILNLATGLLSCVDNDRECDLIEAEIHTS